MCGQLSLQHLLDGGGKQAGEDPVFAKEIVQGGCAGQLLLNPFQRRECGQGCAGVFPMRRLWPVVVRLRRSFGWHGDVLSVAGIADIL